MIALDWCRWTWLGLIGLQPVWFLWVNPPLVLPAGFVLAVVLVPLLVPAWWVVRLHPRGLILGGCVLIFHFSIGVAEAWTDSQARSIALAQVALTTGYFWGLLALRRQPGRVK